MEQGAVIDQYHNGDVLRLSALYIPTKGLHRPRLHCYGATLRVCNSSAVAKIDVREAACYQGKFNNFSTAENIYIPKVSKLQNTRPLLLNGERSNVTVAICNMSFQWNRKSIEGACSSRK